MLNWEQLDKLNEIANETQMSADDRKSEIERFMLKWSIDVHSAPIVTGYMESYESHEPIDPGKECVKARIPLPGQNGRFYYPGA